MESFEPAAAPVDPPRTGLVLSVLAGAAMIFSYLIAYALSAALVYSHVINPWPSDQDPRPAWMLRSFIALLAVFIAIGRLFRVTSHRQLNRIDQICEE